MLGVGVLVGELLKYVEVSRRYRERLVRASTSRVVSMVWTMVAYLAVMTVVK